MGICVSVRIITCMRVAARCLTMRAYMRICMYACKPLCGHASMPVTHVMPLMPIMPACVPVCLCAWFVYACAMPVMPIMPVCVCACMRVQVRVYAAMCARAHTRANRYANMRAHV